MINSSSRGWTVNGIDSEWKMVNNFSFSWHVNSFHCKIRSRWSIEEGRKWEQRKGRVEKWRNYCIGKQRIELQENRLERRKKIGENYWKYMRWELKNAIYHRETHTVESIKIWKILNRHGPFHSFIHFFLFILFSASGTQYLDTSTLCLYFVFVFFFVIRWWKLKTNT